LPIALGTAWPLLPYKPSSGLMFFTPDFGIVLGDSKK
jgi:hypothetical protein